MTPTPQQFADHFAQREARIIRLTSAGHKATARRELNTLKYERSLYNKWIVKQDFRATYAPESRERGLRQLNSPEAPQPHLPVLCEFFAVLIIVGLPFVAPWLYWIFTGNVMDFGGGQ